MKLTALLRSWLRRPASGTGKAMERGEAPDPSAIPGLDPGMPVELMRDFDTALLFGRLTAAGPEELTIQRIPGEMGFLLHEAGSIVLVRGYDAQMNPILLRAKVLHFSMTECTLGELEAIPYETQRKRVRYPLCPPASVYALDDTAQGPPQPCQLLNISTSGACIVSEYNYAVKQRLRLQAELSKEGGLASYHCQVVRVTPRWRGSFEYGLLFDQLNKNALAGLIRDIRTIREETGKKLRS